LSNLFTKKKNEIPKLPKITTKVGMIKLLKIYRFNTIEKPTKYMAVISNLLAILIGSLKIIERYLI
jgi:hypothetical protein